MVMIYCTVFSSILPYQQPSHRGKVTYIAGYHSNITYTQVEVGSPDEVEEIFDAISYCKGASIIRMLHYWIGDKVHLPRVVCVEYLTIKYLFQLEGIRYTR